MEKEIERKIERVNKEIEYLIEDMKQRVKYIKENPRRSVYDEEGHQDRDEISHLEYKIEEYERVFNS